MTYLLCWLLLNTSAETFFQATLFDKALESYLSEENSEKVAETLFLQNRLQELVNRFKDELPTSKTLLWLALAHENLGHLEEAKKLKFHYFETDPSVSIEEKIAFFLSHDTPENAYLLLENSPKSPEVLFTLIELKKRANAPKNELDTLREELLSHSPSTIYHAQVAFEKFSLKSYLMGEKEALTHLKSFVKTYPKTPFSILAYYLIGLDYKKDRKPAGGRRDHFKNPDKAMESYLLAEKSFEALLPEETYWHDLYLRAKLERADLAIEMGAGKNPAKKALFLAQAKRILKDLPKPEAALKLAWVEIELKDYAAALKVLEEIPPDSLANPYFETQKSLLSARAYYRLKQPENALKSFPNPLFEGLEQDEFLEAKILKSLINKDLKDNDHAKLLLSEVINSDLASSVRIKAMVIRALIYDQEGQDKLARRQYESAFRKGGKWAQEKLEAWKQEFLNE
ncbi:MAG: hypothetical protein KDK62_03280 [Chlamydiia bacterium]|nr:hypothetical protein [Chlamydiia bacterium]